MSYSSGLGGRPLADAAVSLLKSTTSADPLSAPIHAAIAEAMPMLLEILSDEAADQAAGSTANLLEASPEQGAVSRSATRELSSDIAALSDLGLVASSAAAVPPTTPSLAEDLAITMPELPVPFDEMPVSAPGPAGTLQTLANYLTNGFWADFSGGTARWYNLGTSGTGANGHVLYYNLSGWAGDGDGISAARATMVREAFKIYAEVLGITFIETTSTADHVDFFFGDNNPGAYCGTVLHSGSGGAINYSYVNVNSGWYGGTSNIGGTSGYTFQTFLHEIGHGLGLGHQGNYNAGSGSPTYANSAIWANDSWQQTMMSYWSQSENPTTGASYAHLISPMAVDWLALDWLYGWQGHGTNNAFNGNTVWGFGSNISSTTSYAYANIAAFADTNAFCIVDGSGNDWVDFSGYGANQVINLQLAAAGSTTGSISSVGGLSGNMTIAVGTVIENAVGGWGHDTIQGNEYNNALYGNAGNDYLYGYGGSDYLSGGDGNDTLLTGGGGHDQAWGGNGDDVVYWGPPSPAISDDRYHDGGAGNDWIYGGGTNFGAVTFNLLAGTYNNGGSFTEEWVNFENYYNWGSGHETVIGTEGNNSLYTGSGNNTLHGRGGTDTLSAGAGNDLLLGGFMTDTVDGGDGNDTLRVLNGEFYDNSYGGVGSDTLDHSASTYVGTTFDFELGTITGTGINGTSAVLSGIEVYLDGAGANTIISDGNANSYYGYNGNDLMIAEIGGEFMYGGNGIDTIDLSRWNGQYIVNMNTGSSNYGQETYQEFENLIAGAGDDTFVGTGGANNIMSGAGSDTVNAGSGKDVITGGLGKDFITGAGGADTFEFNSFAESKKGAANCDVIQGFAAAGNVAGDKFDFLGLGNLNWGNVNNGIYLTNVGNETHCFIKGRNFEIVINDGAGVTAANYTAADFDFL